MFEKYTLKNGLTVILVPKKESESATLMVIYKVGSRNEADKIGGISHFIEHMMFKGTKKRPQSVNISKELDSVGAVYNAFTSKDHTGYFVKLNSEHLDLGCDIISDMLYNSKFEEEEINRERGVILEEFNMYKDNPLLYLEDIFESSIFEGNELGRDIIGTDFSIKAISQSDILAYKNSFYQPSNAVLVVAGKIEEAKKIVEKYFDKKTEEKFIAPKVNKFETSQTEPRILLKYKETEQVHLGIGFPAYSYADPKLDALQILASILGGSMSSRLFIEVRERRGLCYYIKAQENVYEDTGNLLIRAGLDKNKIEEAVRVILRELKKISDEGITEAELKVTKELVKGHMIIEMEDNANVASWYARRQIFLGDVLMPDEKIKRLMKVTKKQVDEVAKDIIKFNLINLAAISPFKDENKFKGLLSIN
ncbi:MAG: pitrilysin family protein [Patescibacteria group bacterium]|nr:pitrilysin family protein [Patescibacteria group bacterium]